MPNFSGTSGTDVWTGGSDGEIATGAGGNDALSGNGGNDQITGDDGGDILNGGDGDDVLISGAPAVPALLGDYYYLSQVIASIDTGTEVDTLNGGAGDDRIWAGYGDNVNGGTHTTFGDYLSITFLAAPTGITFNGSLATQTIGGGTIQGFEHIDWIQGSNYDDVINAQSPSSSPYSHFGEVYGMDGNDALIAGYQTYKMDGGDGHDFVDGRNSSYLNAAYGGAGNDTIHTRYNGTGSAYGGDGDDTIYAGGHVRGGAGDDTVYVQESYYGAGVYGDEGNDILVGNVYGDIMAGGSGADRLDGGGGDDRLQSGQGNPQNNYQIVADTGTEHDVVNGGAGNDIIAIGYGDDADGGAGTDRLILSLAAAPAGVVMDLTELADGSATIGGGVVSNFEVVEEIVTTDFADQLTLGTFEELIIVTARGGNDTITTGGSSAQVDGGEGDDRIVSGIAGDIITGGAGRDTVDYQQYASGVTVNLQAGTGGGGDIITQVEDVLGSELADTISGDGLGNILAGNGGSDALSGLGGNDVLNGGAGTDSIAGGDGNDTVNGGGDADTLTGGSGDDTFQDGAADLNGDTITDFGAGDKIVISNASLAGFSFSLSGSTLTYTGGSLTLTGFTGQLQASAAQGGGVELTLAVHDVRNDFNGDGRSDLLLRATDGRITDWLGTANGGFTDNWSVLARSLSTDWQVEAAGDFNGDGRDDLLLRHDSGTVTDWLGTANGGFTDNWSVLARSLSTDWQVEAAGDFNGDGRDDLLLRHANGTVTDWLGTANGGFTDNWSVLARSLSSDWQVEGAGDFNGDGRDDLLLRSSDGRLTNWLGTADGGFSDNWSAFARELANDWSIEAIGDFNGDGRDDLLLRSSDGRITDWLGTANGGFTDNWSVLARSLSTDWQVEAAGDYNGDGRDDLLLRASDGRITDWLGTANGGFTDNWSVFARNLSNDWQVQPDYLV